MEDFNALASSLALGVGDVRGCLILSRDGLVLGGHPDTAESTITPAWVRFAALGDPERGFAQFGTETWCYVRRGPYAGFAVVGPGARPGLVIDHMDQVLLAAEEGRSRHEGLRGIEGATVVPVSKPRSHLHPDHPASDPVVIDAPEPVAVPSSAKASEELPPSPDPPPAAADAEQRTGFDEDPYAELLALEAKRSAPEPAEGPAAPEPEGSTEADPDPAAEGDGPAEGPDAADEGGEDGDDVDRFSLAREFGQLLQGGEDPADG